MTSRCTQRRAPDGSTCRYSPLPSQYLPGRATVRQKAAERALLGWWPFGLVFRGLSAAGDSICYSVYNFILEWSGLSWPALDSTTGRDVQTTLVYRGICAGRC